MCFIVTLLLFVIVAQIEIASPGTYPPLSNLTRQVTGPFVTQVNPILCSISQWNGCYKRQLSMYISDTYIKIKEEKYCFIFVFQNLFTAKIGGSRLRSMGFIMMKTCWFLWVNPLSSRIAAYQKDVYEFKYVGILYKPSWR